MTAPLLAQSLGALPNAAEDFTAFSEVRFNIRKGQSPLQGKMRAAEIRVRLFCRRFPASAFLRLDLRSHG